MTTNEANEKAYIVYTDYPEYTSKLYSDVCEKGVSSDAEFIDLLKFIDLSMLTTKNLKLSSLDLSETNIHFDPQEIYKKDLSYSKIADHNVSWCSFKGVNLTGANIEDEKESYDYEEAIISVDTRLPRNKARAI